MNSPEPFPAVVAGDEVVGRSVLAERVAVAAGRLRALGVASGTRVGLWAENSVEWIVIALAIERTGAVLVPLNTRLALPEIEWQLDRARVPLVIAGDALSGQAPKGARCVPFNEWQSIPAGDGASDPALADADRDAVIVFTSGTTGRPKGAVLTVGNRLASTRATAAVLPLGPGDCWLASLPFFHVGGLGIIQRCLIAGACIAIPASFAAADLAQCVDEAGVTHLSVVDATLRRILEGRGGRPLPQRVRAAVVGGGPVSPASLEACPQALASYGLTESCAMVTLVRPGASPEQRRTAGTALPGAELRIAEDGVIEVRGPMVMRGYLDDAEATSAALKGGWLRTGDLGELSADGSLRVLSRRDDLIISGGENVYPAEIEHTLQAHPDVADALVIGVPDGRWGEVPLAMVVPRGEARPDLRAFLAPQLARYKLPRIAWVAEIPRLANGKPDRVAARKASLK